MKRLVRIALISGACTLLGAPCSLLQAQEESSEAVSKEEIRRVSEAFGHLIGHNLQTPGFAFDVEGVIAGIRMAAAGDPSPMSEEEYDQAITAIQERAYQRVSEQNLRKAEAFLAQNRLEEGVIELEADRLQYSVQREGEGELVAEEDSPMIHYSGRFLDGTLFTTSSDGDAIALPLSETIEGFRAGITGMRVGERRTLFIHPDRAYGTRGRLPPNSLLIFEVEVVAKTTKSSSELVKK